VTIKEKDNKINKIKVKRKIQMDYSLKYTQQNLFNNNWKKEPKSVQSNQDRNIFVICANNIT
jgi:hypothetical protein